nr:reverse transcriptase domain-containing protein [Tanacetum cinerariifolium]
MADIRTMDELLQAPTEGDREAIVILEINANHFEIKMNLLQLVHANPYHGFKKENPYTHINNLKRNTSTLKFRDVPNDVIKLTMFPYLLEGSARVWENTSKTDDRIENLADQISTLVDIFAKKVITLAPVKAVEESCVTCGGPYAHYNYDATNSNQQSVSVATGIYNQVAPQNRASNYMAPPGFAPVRNSQNRFNQNQGQGNNFNRGNNFHGNQPFQVPNNQVQQGLPNNFSSYKKANDQMMRNMKNQINSLNEEFKNEIQNKMKTEQTILMNQQNAFQNNLQNMLMDFSRTKPQLQDKLFELPKIPLNENCSVMLLKKLPKKLGDLGKFLIPFVNFEADPRVPLILGRSFLRTRRALIDVYGEEITLRVNDEAVTFNLNQTTRYSSTYDNLSVNRIDIIDVAREEYAQEILVFYKNSSGGNTTLNSDPILSDSSPSLTLFKGNVFEGIVISQSHKRRNGRIDARRDNRTMDELLQAPTEGYREAIVILEINANHFEIKMNLLQLVQANPYHGFEKENPHTHINNLKRNTSTLKFRDVPNDVIKLTMFPYLLEGSARVWENTSKTDDRIEKLVDQISTLVDIFAKKVITLAPVNAVEESCVTCGRPHAHYNYDATSSNQPSVSVATGTLLSNTILNPKGEMKAITTRSGVAYEGPSIPTNPSPKKDKLFELPKIPLNENCSVMLLKKLPKKLGDPGKFLIPCDFSRMDVPQALADLDASINLMPLSIQKKLSLPELTPTRMTLELADRSITRPKGVAKDVFVKVGKFHFLTDFVVVNFEADPRVPLILGRSFLRTRRALIDVYGEEITLRVNDEAVTFNLNQTTRYSSTYDNLSVNRIDIIDVAREEYAQEILVFYKNSSGGNTTLNSEPILSDSSPSLTPFKGSDFILEEIKAYLKDE